MSVGPPVLVFHPRRFACNGCGRCCHELTGIHLTRADAARVPFRRVASPHPLFPFYAPLPSLRCPQLGEGMRCAAYERRPLLCRLYPLRLWATPDGRPRVSMLRCPGAGAGPVLAEAEVRAALEEVERLEGPGFLEASLARCASREAEPSAFAAGTVAAPALKERFLLRVVDEAGREGGPPHEAVLRAGFGLLASLEDELRREYRDPDERLVDALEPREVDVRTALARVRWELEAVVPEEGLPEGVEPDRRALLAHAAEVARRRGREGLVGDDAKRAVRLLSLLLADLELRGGTDADIDEHDPRSGSVLEVLRAQI